MYKIIFTKQGGFPLTQDILAMMQSSYRELQTSFCRLCGDTTIISGCETSGSGISAGWLSLIYEGEYQMIPMRASTVKPTGVIIRDEPISLVFREAGKEEEVIYERYATSGTGPAAISWDRFVRLPALKSILPDMANNIAALQENVRNHTGSITSNTNLITELTKNFNTLKTEVDSLARIPKGIITMWSGSVNNIPSGWALCDGTNDTPELQGRFIVGYEPYGATTPENDPGVGVRNFGKIGNKGGSIDANLLATQIPPHTHNVEDGYFVGNNSGNSLDGYITFNRNSSPSIRGSNETHTSLENVQYLHYRNIKTAVNSDGGRAHENRPPYYVLAYIIKL